MAEQNMIGRRFGSRIVLSFAEIRRRGLYWNCLCDCGATAIVAGSVLREGRSSQCVSCGHKANQNACRLPKGEAIQRRMLRQAKRSAAVRHHVWSLSDSDFYILIQKPCFYCGWNVGYNGVDRQNNQQDYTVENCVSACWNCNRAKGDLSVEEFFSHVRRILEYAEALCLKK